MRIGIVISGPLDERSGGYLYDSRFARYLRELGDEVHIVSLPELSYRESLDKRIRLRTLTALLDARCDVLVEDELCHPYLHALEGLPGMQHLPPRVALVHHLRCDESHPWHLHFFVHRPVERRYLCSVDAYIWNGQNTRESVAELTGMQNPRGATARPWIGAEDHSPKPADHELRAPFEKLIFVGNIMRRKNLHVVLQALRMIGGQAPTLSVIGSEHFEPGYARMCRKLAARLDSKVEFLGRIDAAHLPAMYRRHQVLVLPSSHEGYGIVYLEAMRQGLTVIGSNIGGAPEAIGSGGLLVKPGDARSLAKALTSLAENDDFRWNLRRKALFQVESHPRWGDSFALARDMLFALVAERRKQAAP